MHNVLYNNSISSGDMSVKVAILLICGKQLRDRIISLKGGP